MLLDVVIIVGYLFFGFFCACVLDCHIRNSKGRHVGAFAFSVAMLFWPFFFLLVSWPRTTGVTPEFSLGRVFQWGARQLNGSCLWGRRR